MAFAEGFSRVCSSPEGDLVTINVCLQVWTLAPGIGHPRALLGAKGLGRAQDCLAVGYQAQVGGAE